MYFTITNITDTSGNQYGGQTLQIQLDNPTGDENHVDIAEPAYRQIENEVLDDRTAGLDPSLQGVVLGTTVYRKRVGDLEDKIIFYFQGSDKFLAMSDNLEDIDGSKNTVQIIMDGKELDVTKKIERVTELFEPDNPDVKYGDVYRVTLTDFGENVGKVYLRIPYDSMRDTSGNKSQQTDIEIGSPSWREKDDPIQSTSQYPTYYGFSHGSQVDFIEPKIEKIKSSIYRDQLTHSVHG